jgi:hypothetical protein
MQGGRTRFRDRETAKGSGRCVVRMSFELRAQLEEALTRERPSSEFVQTMKQA